MKKTWLFSLILISAIFLVSCSNSAEHYIYRGLYLQCQLKKLKKELKEAKDTAKSEEEKQSIQKEFDEKISSINNRLKKHEVEFKEKFKDKMSDRKFLDKITKIVQKNKCD